MSTRGWEHATPSDVRGAGKVARMPQKRRSKYGAVKTTVDGVVFDSAAEARRYRVLKLMEKAGEIHALALQPRYALGVVPGDGVFKKGDRLHVYGDLGSISAIAIGEYRGDFVYCVCKRGGQCRLTQRVVEDVKGFKTALYRWKKKHVEAQYGIQILEIA